MNGWCGGKVVGRYGCQNDRLGVLVNLRGRKGRKKGWREGGMEGGREGGVYVLLVVGVVAKDFHRGLSVGVVGGLELEVSDPCI